MKRETVFLIGGSGFIGKHLTRCLSSTYNVCVFDKHIDKEFFEQQENVKFYQVNLIEERIRSDIESPDFIINLASVVTADRDMSLFDSLISTNVKILTNLFERFKSEKQLKLFIQFGSSEEYGNIEAPFREDMREEPNSPYALIKQLTTNTALYLYHNYQFPVAVVRPANLYGPGQPSDKFIPYVIERLKGNLPLDVTSCEQKRDLMKVEEFAEKIKLILINYKKAIGEIINVGAGKSKTLRSVIEDLKKQYSSNSQINYGARPGRANEIEDLCCDITKLYHIITE